MRHMASYSSRPEEAVIKVKDGTAYIVLCQDIREASFTDEEAGLSVTVWECEENQIVCPADALDLNDVQANPAKYMDYKYEKPVPPDPAETRMKELEDAIIELAEIIGG